MKKYFLAGILIIFFSCISYSQTTFKLSGAVVDSARGSGLQDVNVTILSRDKNEVLTGTTTDVKGNFTVENIQNKNVRVKFSFVGYQTKVVDSVSVEHTAKMGLIKLKNTSITLPEIVIKTVKPMIEFKVDRQVINLDQVPGNSTSVSDALRNSGAVEVDPATSKITVRGESVKIQMDGRPFEMPDNMLANMPAQMLDQVEVILAPSAKESAEGGTYILNLISKKTILDSYNGSIGLNTGTNNRNFGSLNFNYKKDALNIFGSFFGGLGGYKNRNINEQINYNSVNLYHQGTQGDGKFNGRFINAKLGFDYNLDENNLFTFYGTFNNYKYDSDGLTTTNIKNNAELFLYSYQNDNDQTYKNNSTSFYGFYKKKIDKKGQELTFDAMYTNISNPSTNEMNILYSNNPFYPKLHNTDTKEKSNTLIFKSDYVYPSEIGRIEAGYHFTYRDRENNYTSLDFLYGLNNWQDSMKLGNLFKYNEDIHAAYITYLKTFGKIELKTGLRAENLHTNGNQVTTGETFSENFLNFFPNLNISYKFSDLFQLGFNTFRRVRYPQLYYVNPFKTYNSPNSYTMGNPQIKPTFINSFGINLSRYIDAYYVYSTGLSNYVTSVIDDTVSVSSPYNISSMKNYGIELNLPYYNSPMMPFHLPDFITTLNIQFGYNYRKQSGSYLKEDLNYAGHYKWLMVNVGLKLWYDINSSIYMRYTPATETKRQVSESTMFMGLYFTKAFLDQKLQVNLGISDPFNVMRFKNKTYGTAFYSSSDFRMLDSRSISIGISYRINDYKERRDRNIDDGRDASDTPKL